MAQREGRRDYGSRLHCAGCGREALYLRLCSGCRSASYCSRECQRRHWREGGHKLRCAALAAERQRQQQVEGGASPHSGSGS